MSKASRIKRSTTSCKTIPVRPTRRSVASSSASNKSSNSSARLAPFHHHLCLLLLLRLLRSAFSQATPKTSRSSPARPKKPPPILGRTGSFDQRTVLPRQDYCGVCLTPVRRIGGSGGRNPKSAETRRRIPAMTSMNEKRGGPGRPGVPSQYRRTISGRLMLRWNRQSEIGPAVEFCQCPSCKIGRDKPNLVPPFPHLESSPTTTTPPKVDA